MTTDLTTDLVNTITKIIGDTTSSINNLYLLDSAFFIKKLTDEISKILIVEDNKYKLQLDHYKLITTDGSLESVVKSYISTALGREYRKIPCNFNMHEFSSQYYKCIYCGKAW